MANMSERAGNAKDRIEETTKQVGNRAQEAASALGHRAQEAGSTVAHKAQEAGSTVVHKAQEVASAAEHGANDALSNVGGGMTSLGGRLRQNTPQQGVLGSASTAVADRLEAGGHYLQEHGVRDMAEDFTGVVRQYPLAALCTGFGVGFLLGMTFTRR